MRSLTGAPVIVATASATEFEVLDVAGADHVDAGIEQDVDVLPALEPLRARRVRVRQFVHQRDRRVAGDDRVGVHLLDDDAAVFDPSAGNDVEPVEQLGRLRPAVGLDETDHEVRPASGAAVSLFQHPIRLADARSHPEVDAQPAALVLTARGADAREHLLGRRATVRDVPNLVVHVSASRTLCVSV